MPQLEDAPEFEGWECIEKLGEGGMCSVWRVRPSSGSGPERAIKVLTDLSDGSVTRFADEARLLQRIDHPNVLRIHELHDERRPPWIVMDLLAGRDLEESREQQGPMDPERAARLFADIASGLARVHELGVRHRDLKPANIMLGHDGVARLIDFGIARETSKAHVTQQGFVVGTASYLPPEIFMEDDSHGVQDSVEADVYALGQTLCEVLTGEAVHSRDGEGTSMLVHIMKDKMERAYLDPRTWRPQVPDGLAEIVMAATAQEPEDRIRTAQQLEERLRAWLVERHAGDEAPLTAVDVSALPPPPGTRELRPRPAPSEPGASKRAATPAPVARRAAGTAAAGAAGMGLAAAVWGVVALVGVIALVALAPSAPQAGEARARALSELVATRTVELGRCAETGAVGVGTLSFDTSGRRATGVTLTGDLPEPVRTCLTRAVGAWDLPAGDAVHVRIPIEFK